jgi:ribonuclease P protein component
MLPKKNRLNKTKDFQKVLKFGERIYGNLLLIRCIRNTDANKLGVIVSTKVSKLAVERNRTKRLIRDVIEREIFGKYKNFYLVVVAKKEILETDYDQIKNDILSVLKKKKII